MIVREEHSSCHARPGGGTAELDTCRAGRAGTPPVCSGGMERLRDDGELSAESTVDFPAAIAENPVSAMTP